MRNPRGFTLIEVLVAAAVLGISASALFGLLSNSLFNLRTVEDMHRYELAAQSVMNRVLLLRTLPSEAQLEGPVGNTQARWKVEVKPWVPLSPDRKIPQAILKVKVGVLWQGRSTQRSLELEALKIAAIGSDADLQSALGSLSPQ